MRPSEGLVAEQQTRAGAQGSGRIADLEPGLRLWLDSPVLGPGPGTSFTRDGTAPLGAASRRSQNEDPANPAPKAGIIFDNQYLFSLVTVGIVGLAAVIWFVWGTVVKLTRAARRTLHETGDLLAACAVSSLGFAVGMFTYDTFAFVQVTLLFFVIAALGLTARSFPGR
jgi:O-antigen ligase